MLHGEIGKEQQGKGRNTGWEYSDDDYEAEMDLGGPDYSQT